MPVQDGKNLLALLDRMMLAVSMMGMVIVEAITPRTTMITGLKESIQLFNQPGW